MVTSREGITRRAQLDELYREHAPGCIRLAYLLTNDPASAEDVVQDAFLRIATRLQHLRAPEAFPGYLRRTIVNLAMNHHRRLKVERLFLRRESSRPPGAVEPADPGTRDHLGEALALLSPRERAAIVLRYYEDMSEEQTADILGTSRKAVNSLVGRGIKTLRAHLKGDVDVELRG